MAGEAQQQAASILSPGCCTQSQPPLYHEKRTTISQQAINFCWEGSSTTFIHTCEEGNGGTKRVVIIEYVSIVLYKAMERNSRGDSFGRAEHLKRRYDKARH
ncbi:predicted protein [Histoplasma capsulatum var. duboisii H88]|uniref:Predicted protein n=1 Tax=Ajellomyces capsulatus (strain H88) TaxID=544711 RepID=F0UGP6_AJEC8|nr:predicted protein [Histoplasma capsulatum var. duboisii H88]